MKYTIHALAKKLGITQETIRHYKNLGLLQPEQDQLNGYYYYDDMDAIQALSIRRYRSMELSVGGVNDVMKGFSAREQLGWLKQREDALSHQIELLQHDLEHTQEIRHFMEMTIENQGTVELVNWPEDFSALYLLGGKAGLSPEAIVREWVEAMPYTYLTLKIPREQLADGSRSEPYESEIGLGCISKYRSRLNLSASPPVQTVPGGLSVRTFIAVDDPFHIMPKQLEPMRRYVAEHNFRFLNHSTGWILVTDYSGTKKKYLILVRVRIG